MITCIIWLIFIRTAEVSGGFVDAAVVKLEALRERRPPWPRQIITPIFPSVIMLSLGGERLTLKVLDHYLHHNLSMLPLSWCFFAHLFILEYPDHHQNLISSSLYCPGPLHKISSQSVHNFLSNVVHKQTNRQTNKQTNQRYQKHNLLCQGGNKARGKRFNCCLCSVCIIFMLIVIITSLAKELMIICFW